MIEPASVTEFEEFQIWVENDLRPRVLNQQIRPSTFNRVASHLEFLPAVLEHQMHQKEVLMPIWDYIDLTASDQRVRLARQALRRHRTLFNRLEQAFGVEAEILTAIWGVESQFGAKRGQIPVLSALATLIFRGRRASFFEDEFIAALRLVQSGICHPARMNGSWAGALGHGQFMPSSILNFAVDFDGDGQANLFCDAPDDALASMAHYLKKHGWKKGQPWGFEITLPEGFDYGLIGTGQTRAIEEWCGLGLKAFDGKPMPDYGPGSICLPAGAQGVALLVLKNFHVIHAYNNADAYAIAVGHLSDRIGGGKAFHGRWPVGQALTRRSEMREIQQLLTKAGFDTLGIDGMQGPNTIRAARAWQSANGLPADGFLSLSLLKALRGSVE